MKIGLFRIRSSKVLIGLFIIISTYCFINFLDYKEQRLIKFKKYAYAHCESVHISKVNGHGLFYNYQINNKIFNGEYTLGYNKEKIKIGRSLIDKKCLMIYDSTDNKNNSLLLTVDDFTRYSASVDSSR